MLSLPTLFGTQTSNGDVGIEPKIGKDRRNHLLPPKWDRSLENIIKIKETSMNEIEEDSNLNALYDPDFR